MLILSVLILLLSLCMFLFLKRKGTKLIHEQQELKTKMKQVCDSFAKLQRSTDKTYARLESLQTGYEQKIASLQNTITGMHHYDHALHGQNLSQLVAEDWNSFISCYKELDKDFFNWIDRHASHLTNREMSICILIRMGKHKSEILKLLQCSDSTYITMKSRIKSKFDTVLPDCELKERIQNLC